MDPTPLQSEMLSRIAAEGGVRARTGIEQQTLDSLKNHGLVYRHRNRRWFLAKPKPTTVLLRVSPQLLDQIDEARGLVKRERFMRNAIERELRDPEPVEEFPILTAERRPRPVWQ
jgi:hypothetical protein